VVEGELRGLDDEIKRAEEAVDRANKSCSDNLPHWGPSRSTFEDRSPRPVRSKRRAGWPRISRTAT